MFKYKKRIMDPALWHKISSITLIIASTFTVIGGVGVYHFGNIISDKMQFKIVKSQESASIADQNAAEAQQNAAQANSKALILEVKSKELSIELNKTKTEAEREKAEREKLTQKTILLEKQNKKLTNNQKKIAEFHIKVELYLSTSTFRVGNRVNGSAQILTKNIPGVFLDYSNTEVYYFERDSKYHSVQLKSNLAGLFMSLSPNPAKSIISSDIEVLKKIKTFKIESNIVSFLDNKIKDIILPNKPAAIKISIDINGKSYQSEVYNFQKTNEILINQVEINVEKFFNKITNEYLQDIGL